jgi:hypothetical protein
MRKLVIKIKRKLAMVLIVLLIAITANAQRLKPDTTIKANRVTFITTSLSYGEISVRNTDNIYHNRIQKNRNPDMSLQLTDNLGMVKAFKQVFSDERLKQLLPEKRIFMTLYASTSGKILDMSFVLSKNTLISPQELENLEIAIKAHVSFKFRPEEINGQDFIDIKWIVRYNKVLDGTLK